jgi:hypothetical protein
VHELLRGFGTVGSPTLVGRLIHYLSRTQAQKTEGPGISTATQQLDALVRDCGERIGAVALNVTDAAASRRCPSPPVDESGRSRRDQLGRRKNNCLRNSIGPGDAYERARLRMPEPTCELRDRARAEAKGTATDDHLTPLSSW